MMIWCHIFDLPKVMIFNVSKGTLGESFDTDTIK